MAVLATLRATVVFLAMLTLPGWFILTFRGLWRQWPGLQRWIVAVSISIAFYPVLFYWTRWVFPFWTWGPYKMSALLAVFAVTVIWRMRRHWRGLFAFHDLEWAALAVFAMTLFTRFGVIRNLPYPAWSDSLHHALLTHLTAVQGRLPFTLDPYFPVPLGRYHLGLYSLTATVQGLAQVPAHTALLWTVQVLNGLCGIGVYLVLDRKVGRVGALVGAAVVGLLSHQPAFYVNWGRFTQVAAQAILLPAWLVTWHTLASWRAWWPERKATLLWNALLSAMLTAAVCLLHFRVAVFYLPLLGMIVLWELLQARRASQVPAMVAGIALVGLLTVLAIAPAAWEALRLTLMNLPNSPTVSEETTRLGLKQYFEFPLQAVPILVAHTWLLVLAAVCAASGLLKRSRMVLAAVLWVIGLCLMGLTYRLGIPALNLTNLGAVLILLYLPIGLVIGSAVEELLLLSSPPRRRSVERVILALVFSAGFVASHSRVTEIELHRYFVTPQDVAAMEWIRNNTEPDALFAVNTYFWLPNFPHGTDGGYWIPYFTGRQMTAGVMVFELGSAEYRQLIVAMSTAAERLALDNSVLPELRRYGVDYIYIGARGDFSEPALDPVRLSQAQGVTLVYQNDGVYIFAIQPAEGAS